MVRAEIPVEVTLGFAPDFIDTRTGAPVQVGPQDFQFLADRKNPRSVEDEPRGLPVAKVPLFPLRATWTEWVAPMGCRVISVYEASQKAMARFNNGKVSEISPVMVDNWALVLSEADLLDNERIDAIPATLVVYSAMGDLSRYQERIMSIRMKSGIVDRIQDVRDAVRLEGPDAPEETGDGFNTAWLETPEEDKGVNPPPIFLPGVPPPPS
jgi:hypothetical protein